MKLSHVKEYLTALPICFFSVALFCIFDYPLSASLFHEMIPYDQKRILELFVFASTIIIILLTPSLRRQIITMLLSMQSLVRYTLLAFLLFGAISALLSKIPTAAFLEWSLFVMIILFSFSWCVLVYKYGVKLYLSLSFLCFLVIMIYTRSVIQANVLSHNVDNHMPIEFPYFINIRFFTQYAVFTLALLPLADMWCTKKRFYEYLRAPLFLLAGCWWALVILNGSRGLTLSFIVSTIIGLFVFKNFLLPWVWRQGVYILLGIIIVMFLIISPQTVIDHEIVKQNINHIDSFQHSAIATRLVLYHYAFFLIKKHPFFGVGPMHFASRPPLFLIENHALAGHPHNVFLMIFSEWGMLAGIAISIFAYLALKKFIQTAYAVQKKNKDEFFVQIYACFAMSLCAGLLDALVSGVFVMPLSQMMFAVVAGSCFALYLQANDVLLQDMIFSLRRRFFYSTFLIVITMFSLVFVSIKVISALPHLSANEQGALERGGIYSRLAPRFWAQGWLLVPRELLHNQ